MELAQNDNRKKPPVINEFRVSSLLIDEAIKKLSHYNLNKSDSSLLDINEMKDIQNSKNGDKFVRIVRIAYIFWKYLKIIKIKRKKTKHRKYVIEELVNTEKQYIESLSLIVEKIMKEPLQQNLLTKDEADKIFSNIEAIYGFHKQFFYAQLEKSYKNFTKTTKVANEIIKMLSFFKLYYLFCNNFHHSNEEIEKMKQNKHPFTEKIKTMEYTQEMQNLDLSSLLIKPVQRLPKYVLLFKDLMKNTEETHPDYADIAQCLQKFQQINVENNSSMNFFIKKRKVIELDDKFGKEIKKELNIEIVDPQREFLEEETLHIILDNMPKSVICYFFSDLLLVTETIKGESLIKFLSLDNNSYVRDLANQKYFKWIFSVYGKDGGLTFSTDSKENKKKMMKFIELQILQVLREKAELKTNLKKQLGHEPISQFEIKNNPQKIEVRVLGTMKRGLSYLASYTVYIIEIICECGINLDKEKISTRLFFRYSELSKLNAIIKQEFPGININNLPPKYWFNSQKTKIVEARKLLIEQFLQSVLSKEDLIKKKNHKILDFLGLAEFFSNITISNQKTRNYFSVGDEKEIEKSEKFGRMSVFSAIVESHKSNMKLSRISKIVDLHSKQLIVRLMNKTRISLQINKYTKASEACDEISAQINLQSSLDFKLFIFYNNYDVRVLNDDEYLIKALDLESSENMDNENNEEKKKDGFFGNIKKKIESKFIKIKKNWNGIPEVIYKKYLYLPPKFEENDLKLDPIKLELIADQIFEDIYSFRYIMNFEEYSLIAALQAYIKYGKYEDHQNIMDKIKLFLHSSVLSRKEENYWLNNITLKWKNLSLEISQISEKNLFSSKNKKENLSDHKFIARLIAINSMKNHRLYGAALYWVNFHKKSDTPESSAPIPDNLWLALKFTSIALLFPDDKKIFVEFSYDQNLKFSSYPTSIVITTGKNNFRLNTPHSFEIYQLIDEYEKLHKLLLEMKNQNQQKIL